MKSLIKFTLVVMLIVVFQLAALTSFAESATEAPLAESTLEPEATPAPEATEPMASEEPAETPAPADEETILPEETAAPEETSAAEETVLPEEIIAPEASLAPTEEELILALLDPDRSVRIVAAWDAEHLGVGDAITLRAVVEGYEKVDYELVWQSSADGSAWVDREGAEDGSLTYTLSESNYAWAWRVVVVIHGPAEN